MTTPANLAAVTLDAHQRLPRQPGTGRQQSRHGAPGVQDQASAQRSQATPTPLLLDAGDIMQSILLSQPEEGRAHDRSVQLRRLRCGDLRQPRVRLGPAGADQPHPASRLSRSSSSNLVVNDTGNCATAGWTTPVSFTVKPWITMTVGAPGNQAVIGILGVDLARDAVHHHRGSDAGSVLQGPGADRSPSTTTP